MLKGRAYIASAGIGLVTAMVVFPKFAERLAYWGFMFLASVFSLFPAAFEIHHPAALAVLLLSMSPVWMLLAEKSTCHKALRKKWLIISGIVMSYFVFVASFVISFNGSNIHEGIASFAANLETSSIIVWGGVVLPFLLLIVFWIVEKKLSVQ